MMATFGLGFARRLLAAFDIKGALNAFQRSVSGRAIEVVAYRVAGGQVLGNRAPLAARAEDVHQAIDDLAKVDSTFVAVRFGRRVHSSHRDQPIQPIVITDSVHRDHASRLAEKCRTDAWGGNLSHH
jgi:hypothetical protein